MKKLDAASLDRLFLEIVKRTSQSFLLSLMRVMQSDSDYPLDFELRLDNVVSLLSAGVSESDVLDLVQDHLEGVADVRMLDLINSPELLHSQPKGSKKMRNHPVKPRDRVIVTDKNGNRFAGTCVNINELREPSMRYAVDLYGIDDLVFCSKAQIEFAAPHSTPISDVIRTLDV